MKESKQILSERLKRDIKETLSPKRYLHVLGVAKAAAELAEKENISRQKAELAGLLHDAAKELSLKEMRNWASAVFLEIPEEIWNSRNLLHGFAAAGIGRIRYHIDDAEILSAVAYHTVGKRNMTVLEKIIFLADYIEENRDFPGVEAIRQKAQLGLNEGTLYGFDQTIRHLLDQGVSIYSGTITARNSLAKEMKEECKR